MPSIMIHVQKGELFYDLSCIFISMDANFRLKRKHDQFLLPDVPPNSLATAREEDDDDDNIPDLIDVVDDDPAPCCRHCRRCYPSFKTKL
ncbi:hypothetical protein C8R44DRAFT_877200 [Mycena epipterygia]|nr:hypothetical protein C8R44DRAFT_877200 [Mycena epipterygia]